MLLTKPNAAVAYFLRTACRLWVAAPTWMSCMSRTQACSGVHVIHTRVCRARTAPRSTREGETAAGKAGWQGRREAGRLEGRDVRRWGGWEAAARSRAAQAKVPCGSVLARCRAEDAARRAHPGRLPAGLQCKVDGGGADDRGLATTLTTCWRAASARPGSVRAARAASAARQGCERDTPP
eukprot:scaffold77039_cov63-Phaeocystis_antarctica.AAC.5